MTAFLDLNELINRMTGGNSGTPEALFMHKENRVAGAAAAATVIGEFTSLWQYEGYPAHGAAPGAVAAPDNTTNGGMKQADPGGGRQKWLTGACGVAASNGMLYLCDRLLHISGLSGTVTTAQTVGGSLTRYTDGKGVEAWAEIYTQIGATATTITASYTDDAGNTGNTSPAVVFGGTSRREAQRMIPLGLAAGDVGVRAVASVTVLATTGTAGDFGVTLLKRLIGIPVPATAQGGLRSFMDGPMPEILTDACLFWLWLPNAASNPTFDAQIAMVER
jgi:hypothetical protein